METEGRDFLLKIFKASSLLEERSLAYIKECLTRFAQDCDLANDFFSNCFQSMPDKNYALAEISQQISGILSDIQRTLRALQKQVENSFSENSLKSNLKLRNLISESSDGFIPLQNFLKYKSIKSMTISEKFLAKSLEDSSLLDLSADKHSIRLKIPYKSQDHSVQVFYYNLDTSQAQTSYSSIAEGLLLKPSLVNKVKNVAMLAGNSRYVCYLKLEVIHKVDFVTGEDRIIGQAKGLSYIEVSPDEDLLAGIIDKNRIIIVNLQTSNQIFEHKVTDGLIEKITFHPTEKNLLARFYNTEIVLFRYSTNKKKDINWFKVIPQKLKIINIALISNLIAIAMGQGQVTVLNIDSDSVILNFFPHTYNTMMYSNIITLHFITPSFLLTSGRSQNEFCLTNLDTSEKSHVLTIQSLSRKSVSVCNNCILVTDPSSFNASLIIIADVDGLLKFIKIIDYKLENYPVLSCLTSPVSFYIATKTDCRAYIANIEFSEQKLTEQTLETNEFVNSISLLLSNKLKLAAEKVTKFCKLNSAKKSLHDNVVDCIEKAQSREVKNEQEEIKKTVHDQILSAFQVSLEEMMGQTVRCIESGIKEFQEKEAELDSIFDHLVKENRTKVSMISDISEIYSKNCMKKVRKLEKLEELFSEKQQIISNKEAGIEEKINVLLMQGDFEKALGLIVPFPDKLYSTLSFMNVQSLVYSNKVSSQTLGKILRQMMLFPPTKKQLANGPEWMEILLKLKNWSEPEKEEALSLLSMHPFDYLSSVIK